jgi:MMPL family
MERDRRSANAQSRSCHRRRQRPFTAAALIPGVVLCLARLGTDYNILITSRLREESLDATTR